MDTKYFFSTRLLELRERKGISQKALASNLVFLMLQLQ